MDRDRRYTHHERSPYLLGRDLDPPPAPAVVMMEPHAIKFADAEKVPRMVLPVVRSQGRSIYLKQLQKTPAVISHLEKER
jgi:hypothetical protein